MGRGNGMRMDCGVARVGDGSWSGISVVLDRLRARRVIWTSGDVLALVFERVVLVLRVPSQPLSSLRLHSPRVASGNLRGAS